MNNYITIKQINDEFIITTNNYSLLTAALANLKIPISAGNYDNIKQQVTIDSAHSAGEIVKEIEDYFRSNGHVITNHEGTYPITISW